MLVKFTEYCRPRKNSVFERYRFWRRDQKEGETIDQWLLELRAQAAMCEFAGQEDLMIRDKLVFGVRDERAKERLLREGEVTLQRAIQICQASECTKQQLEGMQSSCTKQVNAVEKVQPRNQLKPSTQRCKSYSFRILNQARCILHVSTVERNTIRVHGSVQRLARLVLSAAARTTGQQSVKDGLPEKYDC